MCGLARGGGWVGKKRGVMFAAFNGLFCDIHFQKKPFQYLSAPRDDYFQLMALQDLQAMSLWAKLAGLSYFGEKLTYKKQYNALDRICKLLMKYSEYLPKYLLGLAWATWLRYSAFHPLVY